MKSKSQYSKSRTRAEEKEMLRLKKIEHENGLARNEILLKEYLSNSDHRMPTTRREFMNAGIISTAGWMLGPSIATLLGSLDRAHAACTSPVVAGGPVPFIHIHFNGGMQTLAIATPRMTNGQPLASYVSHGLPAQPTFETPFANSIEMWRAPNNGFLNGLTQGVGGAANATLLKKAVWVTIPHRDNGDSADPTFSGLGLVERAGRAGSKLAAVGSNSAATGVGDAPNPAFAIAPTRPLQVSRPQDILGAISLSGALSRLNVAQQTTLARTIKNLSDRQAASLTGYNGGEKVAELVDCATGQNVKNVVEGTGSVNPIGSPQETQLRAIWDPGTANGTAFRTVQFGGRDFNNEQHALMTLNVLNNNSLGAAIGIGGFDIHTFNDRAQQEAAIVGAGQLIGKIIATAQLMNSKVFIHVTTNGSNTNGTGGVNGKYDADSGANSAGHFIAFDPVAAPTTTKNQIGGLLANGSADNAPITSNVGNAVAAMFYNYCVFSGNPALFDRVIPSGAAILAAKNNIRALA